GAVYYHSLSDEVIAPYDTTIAQRQPFGGPTLSPKDFGCWLYAQVQAWRCRYATPQQGPRLVVLAGRDYWRWLVEHGLEVSAPLDGMAIGARLSWLKQQTRSCSEKRSTAPIPSLLFADPEDL